MARKLNVAKTYLEPGDNYTGVVVTAPIIGKTFVAIGAAGLGNHPNLKTAAVGATADGVAFCDAAIGTDLYVCAAGVISVTALGAIPGGSPIAVGAGGKAVVAAGAAVIVGKAWADTADGADTPVKLKV